MKKVVLPAILFISLIAVPMARGGMLEKSLEWTRREQAAMRRGIQNKIAERLGLIMMLQMGLPLLEELKGNYPALYARAVAAGLATWRDYGLFLDKVVELVAFYAALTNGIEWAKAEAAKKREKHWTIGKNKRARLDAEADKLDGKRMILENMKMKLENTFPQLKKIVLP